MMVSPNPRRAKLAQTNNFSVYGAGVAARPEFSRQAQRFEGGLGCGEDFFTGFFDPASPEGVRICAWQRTEPGATGPGQTALSVVPEGRSAAVAAHIAADKAIIAIYRTTGLILAGRNNQRGFFALRMP